MKTIYRLLTKYLFILSFIFKDENEAIWLAKNTGKNLTYTKFIVISTARSGSSWLSILLNSHAQVMSYLEVFHGSAVYHPAFSDKTKKSHITVSRRNHNPLSFLNNYIYTAVPEKIKAVGFKIFFQHMEYHENTLITDYLLKNKDVKIIFLVRANLLDSYLSREKALRTDSWISENVKKSSNFKININKKNIALYFKTQNDLNKKYKALFKYHKTLFLTYEMMQVDISKVNQNILQFLKVDHQALNSPIQKQSITSKKDQIKNYEELKDYFSGSKYEVYFDE